MDYFEKHNLTEEIRNTPDKFIPYAIDILNILINDVYIPENRFDYALETIDFILSVVYDANYIDTKAEILIRDGKKSEASKLVEQVIKMNPNFYPSGNPFVFEKILQDKMSGRNHL